jgi:hypothetical protein
MKQYLLSVHSVQGSAPPPPEAMQKAYQAVAVSGADHRRRAQFATLNGLDRRKTC